MVDAEEMFRIEEKWQRRWAEEGLFSPKPDERNKYFATYPYSYMNGLPHIGHAFTCLRVEFTARYRRMKGYNVLFPFAFHCTGMPIVAAASRLREGEAGQIQIMKDMGIGDDEVGKFSDPVYWTQYFPERWESIMRRLGMSIDWSRKFLTTSLNPPYDSFVKWQFNLLKERNFVRKGSHPVIWCPKDNIPVGDHDRRSGEGETPSEYTLIKFRLDDGAYLLAATLRPETVYGQTNIWVNPETAYAVVVNGDEKWILSTEAVTKLSEQGYQLKPENTIQGTRLIGRRAYSFTMKADLPIFPAPFADPSKGTGIVSSVPSDSPDDYIALMDLKREAKAGKLTEAVAQEVEGVRVVEIIDTPGKGTLPAKWSVERLKIKSQADREKLDQAREEVYRDGFYKGIMLPKLPGIGGMPVEKARETVKTRLLSEGLAALMYEPSGEVICRCLTRCIVKIVDNQWFLAYGDPEWKAVAHRAVSEMEFYPEFLRKQFDNVIDWLKDWACVHHTGLGTSLPWDDGWKIESLSDSTLYMAYYTISDRLSRLEQASGGLDSSFFDYIFLGKHDAGAVAAKTGIPEDELASMRREFLYWYPLDLRISGKDLVGNHLTFAIFNHTAVFPEELWPRAYGVNGWITISGSKMSKSAGNSMYLHEAIERYGADVSRLTEAYAGEGFDDPNWDEDFAETGLRRLSQLHETAIALWNAEEEREDAVDAWLRARTGQLYRAYSDSMEALMFKSAVKTALIDMQNALKWYSRRKGGAYNGAVTREFARLQTLMMSPFTPHICEEIWQALGGRESVSLQQLPEPSEYPVSEEAVMREAYLEDVMNDVDEIVKVTGITPKKVYIYTAQKWQVDLLSLEAAGSGTQDRKGATRDVPRKSVERFYRKLATEKNQGKLQLRAKVSASIDETAFLRESMDFLSRELKAAVNVVSPEDKGGYDPGDKMGGAFPGRPAIYIE